MTRKQYKRKIMMMQRNLRAYAIENNLPYEKVKTDRVSTPNWGILITTGKHKGEKLISYSQSWDIIKEILKGTPSLNGIN